MKVYWKNYQFSDKYSEKYEIYNRAQAACINFIISYAQHIVFFFSNNTNGLVKLASLCKNLQFEY